MADDIVARLRKVEPDAPGERTRWYRNPDGPEAAAEIERLRARVAEMEHVQRQSAAEREDAKALAFARGEAAMREQDAKIADETDTGWFDARTFTAQKIATAIRAAPLAKEGDDAR
mgnify:CR=1 FL=1